MAIPESVQKENRPPPTANGKRMVSISGIFDHVRRYRKAPEVRSVFSPRPAGITKVKATPGYFTGSVKGGNSAKGKVAEPGFFAKFRANCEKKPPDLNFSGKSTSLCEGIRLKSNAAQTLSPTTEKPSMPTLSAAWHNGGRNWVYVKGASTSMANP